jgi:squalene-hopene/tetraprenyl-beta-curcumene cyclase
MALLAHLPPTDIVIVKGVQYLVRTQTTGSSVSDQDGTGIGAGPGATWRQREYVSVGFRDILWLDYSSLRHGYPMMALGRWLREIQCREQTG